MPSLKPAKTASVRVKGRHLSCEPCRGRKLRCTRTFPCVTCTERGVDCTWVGSAPSRTREQRELEESKVEIARLSRINAFLQRRLEDLLQTTPKRHLATDFSQLPSPPYERVYQSTAYVYSPGGHTHGSPQNVSPDDLHQNLFAPYKADATAMFRPLQDSYLTPDLSPRFQVQSLARFINSESSERTIEGEGDVIVEEQREGEDQGEVDLDLDEQGEAELGAGAGYWQWS